jgi:hypothetical protein
MMNMPDLDDEKKLGGGKRTPVQSDPRIDPNGLYSGMTKRLAISDGEFVSIGNMPKDMRNTGRLRHTKADITDLSRGRFS